MNDPLFHERRRITYCGLILALLSSPVFAAVYRGITGENHSNLQLVTREKLPLSSIGLQTDKPLKSILRGFALAVAALIVTVGL
jgi:hypothetical protein